jgi:NAD(P)H-nitrite reductase large subunit
VWPLAYAQGAVAGAQMAGGNALCQGGVPMNSIEVFGLPMIAIGETTGDGGGEGVLTVRSKADAAVYKKLVLRDNRIVGALFIGEIERAGIVGGLMRDAVDVGAFKDELLKESLGYIYVPKQYRARHISPLEV